MAASERRDHPRFLLATDLDPAARPHLEFATRFADRLAARTTVFHAQVQHPIVVDVGAPPSALPVPEDCDALRRRLHAALARVDTQLPVHAAVEPTANVRDAILAAADRIDAELIMLPTHGRSGLERAVLGSVAEQVLRRSRRPVLLLTDRMLPRPGATADRGPVVVATDLSPAAEPAQRAAVDLAGRLGTSLLLVSVLPARQPPPFGGGAPPAPPHPDDQARIQERAGLLREQAAALGSNVATEVRASVEDDAAAAIVAAAATHHAELLVLATHGRRGLARMIKGSVAEQVVRHATTPVLCMPLAQA